MFERESEGGRDREEEREQDRHRDGLKRERKEDYRK